jgi:hypothetical protein
MKKLLISTLLLTTVLGITQEPKQAYGLKLQQNIYITDKNGVANPNVIIRLVPSNIVKICLPDGTEYTGMVKSIEEQGTELVKVFGEFLDKPESGFGFVLRKDGLFAGAMVFKDTDTTYTLEFSAEAKGYIFIKKISEKKFA